MNTSMLAFEPPVRAFKQRATPAPKASHHKPTIGSDLFPTKNLFFRSGPPETIIIGGRNYFDLVEQAFRDAGIKQILFVGWGSQGPAQAQNLRDTLKEIECTNIKVCVGLRADSKSIPAAQAAGFNYEDGTLGDMYELAGSSDLVICLVSDGAMVEIHKKLFASLKRDAIIGISHGFIVGYLQSIGEGLPAGHDVIMTAPKGMGPSLRKLYLQSIHTEGAGINSSVAVSTSRADRHQLVMDVALAWSVGIGSPVTFGTDFLSEVKSDLFGERAILLGGLYATSEFLNAKALREGLSQEDAFLESVCGITGTITDLLSKYGMKNSYNQLTREEKFQFHLGYIAAYPAFDLVMGKIYGKVESMDEIQEVVKATKALSEHPMEDIESKDPMWAYGREHKLYGKRPPMSPRLGYNFGFYSGGIVAQLHTLLHHGHAVSEVINESYIEAADSLNPYMDSRGVAFMVDNCSTTARLGTRYWAPHFVQAFEASVAEFKPTPEQLEQLKGDQLVLSAEDCDPVLRTFFDDDLHGDIAICMKERPSVRISVPLA